MAAIRGIWPDNDIKTWGIVVLQRAIQFSFLILTAISINVISDHSAHAHDLGVVEASHSTATLRAEHSRVATGETVWLSFEIDPREKWHSYWKNYGDSGAAPLLYWTLPDGVKVGEPLYAVPHRMPIGPLMNYGYEGSSSLLVPLAIDETFSGSEVSIALSAEWLVCEIECVPQDGSWSSTIPVGEHTYSDGVGSHFSDARAALPEPAIWGAHLTVYPAQSRLQVFLAEGEVSGLIDAYFFPAGEGVTEYAAAQEWRLSSDGLYMDMQRTEGGLDAELGTGILKLFFEDGSERAVEIDSKLIVETAPTATEGGAISAPQIAADIPLWQAGLFALLGGMVLNLMPCVFPVLSLKAFSFISANAKSVGERRQEGWAYTFGIWLSFMVIVALLLTIKSGGAAIGWGFQLQEPSFVGVLVLIMVLVALSLSGMFNIQFGVEGAGQELAAQGGNKGAFFQGVLATLVATPCTAPLMAPAIGFALTQSAPIVFVIFSLLAFGLALPLLALSYSGTLARLMPRPGAWMEKLKEALAFPMYLTAAWLLYVFNLQAGATATLALLVALITIIFGVWLWQSLNGQISRAIAVLLMLGGIGATIYQPFEAVPPGTPIETADDIEVYSEERLAELISDGEPVFAYFTAEWCITCKVNEQVALYRDETQELFAEKGIRLMKGDWTNRNAEIANLLTQYGRAGVPLYLYFPKGQSEAVVLPEVLSIGVIADAIEG